MSANNQILVKEHKGKFYVFDVMAESWGGYEDMPLNTLSIKAAQGSFDSREEAHEFAHKLDNEDIYPSEYGVVDEVLWKDGADVFIKESDHTPEASTNGDGSGQRVPLPNQSQ